MAETRRWRGRGPCVAGLFALLLPAGAMAAEEILDCTDPQTQAAMNMCAGAEYRRADAELQRVYDALVRKLAGDGDARNRLRSAQRAWLSYRDLDCGYEGHRFEGGSIAPMVEAGCLAERTRERTKVLRGRLTCTNEGC